MLDSGLLLASWPAESNHLHRRPWTRRCHRVLVLRNPEKINVLNQFRRTKKTDKFLGPSSKFNSHIKKSDTHYGDKLL